MNLPLPLFTLLSASLALGLGGRLLVWEQDRPGRTGRDDLSALVLGESRRAFAFQFFVKADRYFHRGYYPTIFDTDARTGEMHMTEKEHEDHAGHDHDHDHGPRFRDPLERFGSHFHPSEHRHVSRPGEEREILPWLRLAAELDPENPETYVVSAYWLRKRLDRVDEAERFLREGLRQNPRSHEILFELGEIAFHARQDLDRARNLYELAEFRWVTGEGRRAEPDVMPYAAILAQLGVLEEAAGDLPRAITQLEKLKRVARNPAGVQERIDRLRRRLGTPKP